MADDVLVRRSARLAQQARTTRLADDDDDDDNEERALLPPDRPHADLESDLPAGANGRARTRQAAAARQPAARAMAGTPRAANHDDDDDDDDDESTPRSPGTPRADPEPIQARSAPRVGLRNLPRLDYANDGALLARTAAADETGVSPDGDGDIAPRPDRARPHGQPSGQLAALHLGANPPRAAAIVLANHRHASGASAVVAHAAASGRPGTIDEALGWRALAEPSPDPADARKQSPYAPLECSRNDVCAFGLESFDEIGVQNLIGLDGWSFHQMGEIPVAVRESFTHAFVDIISALKDAIQRGDLVARDRALKALALLPTLLLRLPPPGSDRTATHGASVYERIGKWARGDIGALVQDLVRDAHINSAAAADATARTGRSSSRADEASKASA
jgi:hypothetical protein